MATTRASRPAAKAARDLYDELRASHAIHRTLCKSLTGSRTPEKRREAFLALDVELAAHAAAEERAFFQLSGRILTDTQKARLAGQYRRDYERLKRESA